MDAECSCPRARAGSCLINSRAWSDMCPEHGVGTEYFQKLEKLPYGYAQERNTSREEYLDLLKRLEDEEADERSWIYESPATVCITHQRFIPCRKQGEHDYSSRPEDVESVRNYHTT